MKKLLVFFLFTLLMGCEQKEISWQFSNNEISNVNPQPICTLSENIAPLSTITQFSFLNDFLILLSSNSDLFLYSDSGAQRLVWNKIGKASNEYLDARQFYVSENYIYVFDAAQLKMVIYDRDYKYVCEKF